MSYFYRDRSLVLFYKELVIKKKSIYGWWIGEYGFQVNRRV
jgi:hypothetical protein